MVLITWGIAILSKAIIDLIQKKNHSIRKSLIRYGGMPSAHAACVTALTMSILLIDGFDIPFFIIITVAIIVVRDTLVIRIQIDSNTHKISKLTGDKAEPLLIAHNRMEVLAGIMIGAIFPVFLDYLF